MSHKTIHRHVYADKKKSGDHYKRLKPVSGRVQTLTCDDGKEFADHVKIDRALGSTTHFAEPYSSWQRGSN